MQTSCLHSLANVPRRAWCHFWNFCERFPNLWSVMFQQVSKRVLFLLVIMQTWCPGICWQSLDVTVRVCYSYNWYRQTEAAKTSGKLTLHVITYDAEKIESQQWWARDSRPMVPAQLKMYVPGTLIAYESCVLESPPSSLFKIWRKFAEICFWKLPLM